MIARRNLLTGLAVLALAPALPLRASPADREALALASLERWVALTLELVRHTATYSPPIASRAFAYLSVIAYEATRAGGAALAPLAGQLTALTDPPLAAATDPAATLDAALAKGVAVLFGNTGPTGQRALASVTRKMAEKTSEGAPEPEAARARGEAVAAHVLAWAESDGASKIENMGFPRDWPRAEGPGHWVPTSKIVQQQAPLLPDWGNQRTFALASGADCPLPPPPAYSTDPASPFYAEAREVYEISRNLTDDQRAIARFWSDDPMLSSTPSGHWLALLFARLASEPRPLAQSADAFLRLSVGMADAFIVCWHEKFRYNLLRPVTYIKAQIDKTWEPLLITPPFPEYPSGHSTQSGAAATVMTGLFGEGTPILDETHLDDDLPARSFATYWQAAEEAAVSRIYGGIHFRTACVQGLEQGRRVGAKALALVTL